MSDPALAQAMSSVAQAIKETFPNFVAVPTASSAAGTAGQVACDTSFFYVCVADNTWRRVALSTF